jgi:hypothetical protein
MDRGTLETPFSGLLLVQSRVFEVIASNHVLSGAIHDLAQQFGVAPDDFLHCLDGLARAGWVTVKTDRETVLSIQLEHRSQRLESSDDPLNLHANLLGSRT